MNIINKISKFRWKNSAFNPLSLSGLTVWLKQGGPYWQNTPGTTPANVVTNPVRQWDDVKAPTNHAIAPSDATRPTLTTVTGGLTTNFDGIDDNFRIIVTLNQPFWVFQFCNPSIATGTRRMFDSTNRCLFGIASSVYQFYAGTAILTGGVATTGTQVLAARFDGVNSKLYKNGGAAIISGNIGSAGTGGLIYLGTDDGASTPYMCTIREFLDINGAMTKTEVDDLGRYLAAMDSLAWAPIV